MSCQGPTMSDHSWLPDDTYDTYYDADYDGVDYEPDWKLDDDHE